MQTSNRRISRAQNKPWRRRLLATTIAHALALSANAATISVDNATDVGDVAHCTLRDAVKSSNNDVATGGCIAGNGDDVIAIDPSLSGETITLTGGQLTLKSNVTIQGPGADQLSISGDNASRIFSVKPYVNVTISDLALVDGSASSGGAIDNNSGILTIQDSLVSNNTASGSGGAIYNYYGHVQILRSTLTGNSAGSRGGVLYAYYNAVSIENSTVTGNSADKGGALFGYAFFTVAGSTFANNSGTSGAADLDTSGELALSNTIIADAVSGVACTHGGTFLVNQNNLIEDGTCQSGGINNITGDPAIGPLSANGGSTQTHALTAGSIAIDAGDLASCYAVDQAGMPRPFDGNGDGVQSCDIGAFEFIDLVPPQALLNAVADVTDPGGLTFGIPVSVSDNVSVDASSLDDSDVVITGPNGFSSAAVLVNRNPVGNASVIVSEYQLTPPGGQWDVLDNGTYEISLSSDEVFDMGDPAANGAAGSLLGSFSVTIADIELSGNGLDIANADITPDAGDGTQFGTVLIGSSRSRLFRITNAGAGVLTLSGPVSVTGPEFAVTTQPAAGTLLAGESTLFEITFSPAAESPVQSTVTVASDDGVEGTFTFDVAGNGTAIATAPVAQDMNVSITDAAPPNAVIAQVSAVDAENNIRAQGGYAIVGGDPSGVFWVDDSGQVRVQDASLLDRNYALTVQVLDETDLSDSASVNVRITQGDLLFRAPME